MVTVYTKNNCVQCNMTKRMLKDSSINFEEILANNKDIEYIKSLGIKSLPAVFLDGNPVFSGFAPSKIKSLIIELKERNRN